MNIQTDAASAIILDREGNFLLQKKDQGYFWFPGKWCLFGGHIKDKEDPKKAIERELMEELNYPIRDLHLYKITKYQERRGKRTRGGNWYIYVGKFTGKPSDISLDEGAGFAFFSASELKSLDMIIYNNKRIIKEFLRDNR